MVTVPSNPVMKQISYLTMIFLPASFASVGALVNDEYG